jgi:hypothetical protein
VSRQRWKRGFPTMFGLWKKLSVYLIKLKTYHYRFLATFDTRARIALKKEKWE